MKYFVASLLLLASTLQARADAPRKYDSKNFIVQTDLPEDEAKQLLQKLETMLVLVSKYWAVPNRQKIECVVIKDFKNWTNTPIDERAVASLRARAGVTLADFKRRGSRVSMRAVAYSIAKTSVVQHEAVHAYSYYAFGHCGPQWYAEGMAEVGSYWVEGETRVTAPRYVTRYLSRTKRRPIREITTGDTARVGSWQNYAWRWALCHLLANNTNYSKRFRPLGLSMLAKKKGSFSSTYGNQIRELEFEYNFFLDHVAPGFDVGRCSWDWDTRFRKPKPGKTITAGIKADRGWQASKVRVQEGQRYKLSSRGEWKLTEAGDAVVPGEPTAPIAAVVMKPKLQLGEPFDVPRSGEFTAKESGDLYLRCADEWTKLNDNSGEATVAIQLVPDE